LFQCFSQMYITIELRALTLYEILFRINCILFSFFLLFLEIDIVKIVLL
jgi:hypothetical protein